MVEIEWIDVPSSSNSDIGKSVRKTGKAICSVPRLCRVCLGKATGYHYEVASCNGCKSFFRRVITENLSYMCIARSHCYDHLVPGDSAPKCRSCRFNKCVEMGMNPLAIHSELRKFNGKHCDEENLPMIVSPSKSIELQISELIEHLAYLDMKTALFRDCSYNPMVYPTLREAVKEEISIISIADRMGPMPGWPIPQETAVQFRYNKKRWPSYDMLTFIEMTKTFDFFRKLSERDRYFLFRDTLLMVANLTRSYFSVEKGSDEIALPDGTTPPVRRQEWMPADLHHKYFVDVGKRAIGGLIRKKMTKTEYLLIRAILLCNSAAPEISKEAREILFMERKKYTMALLNHTMAGHGSGGPGRFAELLNIIDVLERQQKDQRDVHLLMTIYRSKDYKVPLFDEVLLSV